MVDNHVGPRVRMHGLKSLLCHLLGIFVMVLVKLLINLCLSFPISKNSFSIL